MEITLKDIEKLLDSKLHKLSEKIDAKFNRMEDQFKEIDKDVNSLGQKIENLTGRVQIIGRDVSDIKTEIYSLYK